MLSGTAIYAEFVLGDGITDLTFHMDDVQLPQGFEYNLPKGAYFNATVYNNSDVTSAGTGPNGTHNLTISSVQRMAFDFAVYTYVTIPILSLYAFRLITILYRVSGATNASTTTSSSSAPLSASDRTLSTGAIIGVVISALVALCLALVILVICIKKHRHVHKRNPAPAVDPSEVNPSTSVYLSTVVEMMEDAQSALWSTTNGRSSFGGTTSRTTEGATLGELKEQLEHMRITQEQLQQMLKEVQVHLDAPSASRLRETHWRHISWLTQEMAVLRAQAARLDLDSNVHLQAQSPNVAVEKQLSYEMNRDSP